MGNLFSSKKHRTAKTPPKGITPYDQAVLDIKIVRDKLVQYQKKIQVVMEREKQVALQLLRQGDKKRAMLALKKKRYKEQMLAKTDNELANVQEMLSTLEFSKIQKNVVDTLALGNETLKKLNNEMSIEEVERLMEETEDAIAYQNEISELLAGQLTTEDDEAVQAELDAIERETLGELPTAPTTAVVGETKPDEKEEEPVRIKATPTIKKETAVLAS